MADRFPLEIWITTVSKKTEDGQDASAWGTLLLFGPFTRPIGGGAVGVTPSEIELAALVKTLEFVKRPLSTILNFVSLNAPLEIAETIAKAKANDWKNDAGVEMLHADLWKRLDEQLARFGDLLKLNWIQTSGPSGSDGTYLIQARGKAEDELADELKKHKIGQAAQ